MNQQKIGSFIRELRKEQGITQEQLAEQFNVSARTISRWETGHNMPDISLLVEISEFFDVSIPEIINGVCALILCYILEAAGVSGQNSFFEKLYLYCETLVPVTITMIVFYSTGLINKLHRKNRSSVLDNFPKAIRIIITAVLAFAVAALLKLFLSNVLGL